MAGSAEARGLSAALTDLGIDVSSTLPWFVSPRRTPVGELQIVAFDTARDLAEHLRAGHFTHLVDATAPFPGSVNRVAAEAARLTGVQAVRLVRPSWADHEKSESWHWVDSLDEARMVAEGLAGPDATDGHGESPHHPGRRCPFVTTGRRSLATFAAWADRPVLARVVSAPPERLPAAWTVLVSRGPHTVDSEARLMRDHGVDVLVARDSGGPTAKLDAAGSLAVPVVMLRRPPAYLPVVTSVSEALAALG